MKSHTMKMRNVWVMLAMFAAAISIAGCNQDNIQAPQGIRSDPLAGGYPQNVAISGLHEKIVIGRPVVDTATEDQPMRVTVPLRSVVDYTLRTQYKFTFLDSKGRPVRTNRESWNYQVIAPKTGVFLENNALDTDAVDWRLEVRLAK